MDYNNLVLVVLDSISLFVLLCGVGYWTIKYKKTHHKFMTIKKLVVMSLFFAFFLIQAAIGRYGNVTSLWISFDGITVTVIGFLFGPLEAMLYGVIADTTRTFMLGWTWLMYYAVAYPMSGLIFGSIAYWYKNTKQKENIKLWTILFQVIVLFVIVLGFAAPYFGVELNGGNTLPIWQAATVVSIAMFFLEWLFIHYYRRKDKQDICLLSLLCAAFVLGRTVDVYVIRAIGDSMKYYSGWAAYVPNLLFDMFKESYLLPLNLLFAYSLIKITIFASKQVNTPKEFGIWI